jgi:hypothetical protein
MTFNIGGWTRGALAALLFLFAGLFWLVGGGTGEGWYFDRNNPERFHLWVTGKSYHYTFTYDPRETDIWMFNSGGAGTPPTSHIQPIIPQALTNRSAK